MNEKLTKLLKRTLSKEQFEYILNNYNEICNDEIMEIGIDSLDYMNLLWEFEEICSDVENIPNTLKEMEGYLIG